MNHWQDDRVTEDLPPRRTSTIVLVMIALFLVACVGLVGLMELFEEIG